MSENSNDNKENRNLKKLLKALNLPYKRSKAYEAFGDVKSSNNESSVFWNSKVDYVVKYENAKIDNPQTKDMEENEDKNIPLMEPTFFASDDPNNPKYVSLEEKKSSIKEKVKSLSEETKKVLNDVSKDEELKETRKAFGMSYEEFLELYEKTNGFQDDIEIDKAIEALDIFDEKNNSSENSSTQRKRYKITGRKKL